VEFPSGKTKPKFSPFLRMKGRILNSYIVMSTRSPMNKDNEKCLLHFSYLAPLFFF